MAVVADQSPFEALSACKDTPLSKEGIGRKYSTLLIHGLDVFAYL